MNGQTKHLKQTLSLGCFATRIRSWTLSKQSNSCAKDTLPGRTNANRKTKPYKTQTQVQSGCSKRHITGLPSIALATGKGARLQTTPYFSNDFGSFLKKGRIAIDLNEGSALSYGRRGKHTLTQTAGVCDSHRITTRTTTRTTTRSTAL